MLNFDWPAADGAESAAMYRVLETLSVGVLLLQTGPCVTYANDRALRQLRRHRIVLTPEGSLLAQDPHIEQRLQTLLAQATRGCAEEGRIPGSGMGLPAAAGTHALALRVIAWPMVHHPRSSSAGFGAILISECDGRYQVPAGVLADLYGLTTREIHICQGFINAGSLEALAPRVGLQLGSLRTKMKSIYQKTGRHSQAALMRLLMEIKLDA